MPENSIIKITKSLPLIYTEEFVVLPHLTTVLYQYAHHRFRELLEHSKCAVIAYRDSANRNKISEFGIIANVSFLHPPREKGEKGEERPTPIEVTGFSRVRILGVEELRFGEYQYYTATWELIKEVPLDDATWNAPSFQRDFSALTSSFFDVAMLLAGLYKNLYGSPVINPSQLLTDEDLVVMNAFNHRVDRGTLGIALDQGSNIFSCPLRLNLADLLKEINPALSLPERSRNLVSFLGEPSVKRRFDMLSALLKAEATFLKEIATRLIKDGVLNADNPTNHMNHEAAVDPILKKLYDENRARLPAAVLEIVDQEMKRLEMMSEMSSERALVITYVKHLLSIPWGLYSEEQKDIRAARRILGEDHWGLPKPKNRIIEYLAVAKRNPNKKAPILCFVGPPGVGKTSLGKSIARATGREFVRISMGGVHDEADIRGHRRTYVGAFAGRIITGIISAKKMNPLFMIDEVDKIPPGGGPQGDPAAALLEVLDPEQNHSFVDHYTAVPVDLSKVLFVTTANTIGGIPGPLLDRMEVVEFTSYTEEEKIEIAKRFLIPKERAENGLTKGTITDEALSLIINEYTAEAGVRDLERKIAAVFRKRAAELEEREEKNSALPPAEGRKEAPDDEAEFVVTAEDLSRYLPETEKVEVKHVLEGQLPVGVAPALYVGANGGSLLFIEVIYKKAAKRQIKVTGTKGSDPSHTGTVIEESADCALNFLFKKGGLLTGIGIPDEIYVQIHASNGGIPKDGTSAGVAILWALFSMFTGERIKKGLTVTGEITPAQGKITAVGGIKEKILGAVRAGATQVIIPKANAIQVKEIPESVKAKIEIILCDSMIESLKIAFPNWPRWKEEERQRAESGVPTPDGSAQ